MLTDVIEFRIDRRSGVSTYMQIIQQAKQAMRLGLLNPGDRLPTAREVVEATAVNPNTVLKAYRELELSGLVEARQGSGTYVRAALGSAPPEVMAHLRKRFDEWVGEARASGLDNEDIDALIRAVLNDKGAQR